MPTNRNLNQRIKAALYQLKQCYGGGPISVYQNVSSGTDPETGEKTSTNNVTVIRVGIVLPARVSRDVIQSISQISANKAFVYGGSFDAKARTFILDRRDCPLITELKESDWLVYDGRKYEIKTIQEFEYGAAWVIVARHQIGDVGEQIFPVSVDHLLDLTQSSAHTPDAVGVDQLLALTQSATGTTAP